jgi:hypothetical protein
VYGRASISHECIERRKKKLRKNINKNNMWERLNIRLRGHLDLFILEELEST